MAEPLTKEELDKARELRDDCRWLSPYENRLLATIDALAARLAEMEAERDQLRFDLEGAVSRAEQAEEERDAHLRAVQMSDVLHEHEMELKHGVVTNLAAERDAARTALAALRHAIPEVQGDDDAVVRAAIVEMNEIRILNAVMREHGGYGPDAMRQQTPQCWLSDRLKALAAREAEVGMLREALADSNVILRVMATQWPDFHVVNAYGTSRPTEQVERNATALSSTASTVAAYEARVREEARRPLIAALQPLVEEHDSRGCRCGICDYARAALKEPNA